MRVFIAGDYMPTNRIGVMVENSDYSFFKEVRTLTSSSDLSIVNLEAPIVSNDYKPIFKCGPNLKCSPKTIESLKYGGFDIVTLANNHIMDYGKEGLHETIRLLNSANIEYVGVGNNLKEAAQIKYFEKGAQTIAIINCCEHEFSIAEKDKAGANPLNPISQCSAIRKAKEKADFVLVIVHGGPENWQLPSPRMVETYRFFIDMGADAVINHHQHCFSGYEIYNEKPIFYGLGNFCFDANNKNIEWYEGYAVELKFEQGVSVSIYPYIQCYDMPMVHLLPSDIYNDTINQFNKIICSAENLKKKTEEYYLSCSKALGSILEPYDRQLLKKLYKMGLVPRVIKGRKAKLLENYIMCESHRDKMEYFFKNIIK